MVIIFYDAEKESIHICTERNPIKIIPVDDPNLMSQVPNDDILYVQNANYITKEQLGQWLEGESSSVSNIFPDTVNDTSPDMSVSFNKYADSKWLCPAHNGAIHIPDIKTAKYPDGVQLVGKYDFVPVESLGGFEDLEESMFFNTLLAKGKIKVVDYEYVKKNYSKKRRKESLADAALNAIIINNDRSGSAERVAASGGIGSGNSDTDPIEFFVE